MPIRTLVSLFICYLVPFIVGNGLLTLLPVYVARFDANPTATGFYLAFTFAGLTVGSLSTGWLLTRVRSQKGLMIVSALVASVMTVLIGQANSMAQLALFTVTAWFAAGILIALVTVLTGLYANKQTRGRTFGIIGVAPVIGGILGGLSAGPIADHLGYTALFTLNGLAYIVVILAAFGMKSPAPAAPTVVTAAPAAPRARMNTPLLLLFCASVLVSVANFNTGLIRPLVMSDMGFDSTAISSTIAVANLVNLPLPFLLGWLSDRRSRKQILIGCYLIAAAGMMILGFSTMLWHFWLAQALISLLSSERAVGSALATDLVPPKTLNTSLARLSTAPWIGAVIGYSSGGLMIEALGANSSLFVAVAIALTAGVMVIFIRARSVTQPVSRPVSGTFAQTPANT